MGSAPSRFKTICPSDRNGKSDCNLPFKVRNRGKFTRRNCTALLIFYRYVRLLVRQLIVWSTAMPFSSIGEGKPSKG